MARSPRQRSVGASAAAVAKSSAASGTHSNHLAGLSSDGPAMEKRPEPRTYDDDSGAHDADRACVGGEEGEEQEAAAQREQHEAPIITANGGVDRQARP